VFFAKSMVVNDLETHYLEGGPRDAPTVVFLHDGAWGASAEVTWGGVLPLASLEFRVIAPDLLGFGGSAKVVRLDQSPFGFRIRHVLALLDALDAAGPVHLVGNSFGGSVALRALTDSAAVGRIASVATISGTGGPWRTAASGQLASFDGTVDDMRRIVELLCDDFDGIDEQVHARYRSAAVPGHYQGMLAPHVPVPAALAAARAEDPYPASLSGVDIPVLLVAGRNDVLVEPGWTEQMLDYLPHARVETLPYKHSPNISHPVETWQVLRGFLADSAGAGEGIARVAAG
jgi:pimeloyl-ACP methyl ester carboxylesterase